MRYGQRLEQWRAYAENTAPVHLAHGLDLTMHPSNPRGSFPGLPPLHEVTRLDAAALVQVPCPMRTAIVGYVLGAAAALLLCRLRPLGGGGPLPGRPALAARLGLVLASLAALRRWGSRRSAVRVDPSINKMVNVSSDPAGECNVVPCAVTISNSHAGTHADTPRHFLPAALATHFHDDQYTGECHVLDISPDLRRSDARAVTRDVLAAAFRRTALDPAAVWRLLLVTRTVAPAGADDTRWSPDFAHLSTDGARFLATAAPRLLLVGVDTPSVDAAAATPIAEHAHGALWEAQVAILENLDLRRASPALAAAGGVLRGGLLTTFCPGQEFEDARGCAVTFFPQRGGEVL